MKASQVTLFTSYDTGMDALLARAKLLGVPQGADVKMDALVFLGPDGLPAEADPCDEAAPGATLLPVAASRSAAGAKPQGEKKGNCKFCDSWLCKSEEMGGKSKCICCWDSAFDLTKLSAGAARYCKIVRRWHDQNRRAPTLKGVNFRVTPTSSGAAGGARRPDAPAWRPGPPRGGAGGVTVVASLQSMLGEGEAQTDFDAWLAAADADGPGISVIGDMSGADGIEIEAEILAPIVELPSGGDGAGVLLPVASAADPEVAALRAVLAARTAEDRKSVV